MPYYFIYFFFLSPRLKTVEMVIRNTQGAEGVLKQYEDCLREVNNVPRDGEEVEAYRAKLKVNCISFFYEMSTSVRGEKKNNHPISQSGTVPIT